MLVVIIVLLVVSGGSWLGCSRYGITRVVRTDYVHRLARDMGA